MGLQRTRYAIAVPKAGDRGVVNGSQAEPRVVRRVKQEGQGEQIEASDGGA